MEKFRQNLQAISWKRIIAAIILAGVFLISIIILFQIITHVNPTIADVLRDSLCEKQRILGGDKPEIQTDCFGAGVALIWSSIFIFILLSGIVAIVITKQKRVVSGLIALVGAIILVKIIISFPYRIAVYNKKENNIPIRKEIGLISTNLELFYKDPKLKESRRQRIEEVLHRKSTNGSSAIPSDVYLLSVEIIDRDGVPELVLNFSKELILNRKATEVEQILEQTRSIIENNRVPHPHLLFYKFLVKGEEISKIYPTNSGL